MKKVLVISMIAVAAASQAITVTYSGAVVNIPDNLPAGATASEVVSGTGLTFSNINSIGIRIRHTWQGDLTVTLTKVGGPSLVLTNRPGTSSTSTFGFSADNFGVPGQAFMVFNDTAATTYDAPQVAGSGINNVVGPYKAEGGVVDTFNGVAVDGTWQLKAVDAAGGDTGAIESFYIEGEAVPEPATLAALGLGALAMIRRRRSK